MKDGVPTCRSETFLVLYLKADEHEVYVSPIDAVC